MVSEITYSSKNNKIIHKSTYTRVHNIGRRTFFIDKQGW